MSLDLVTPPAVEPIVSVIDVKLQCSLGDVTDHDVFLEQYLVPAARERGELSTRRQWIEATWTQRLDGFPAGGAWLEVPRPPLIAVVSVQYVDLAGVLQTMDASAYDVDAPRGPRCARGRIAPVYGTTWPSTRAQLNAVRVTFRAGYGTKATDVPTLLRQAMLMDVATLFEHRENIVIGTKNIVAELPRGSAAIYDSYRSYPRVCTPR
ncbi:MAG: hypothetical protein AB7Q29_14830 [Vicinamibacterales bacterium]